MGQCDRLLGKLLQVDLRARRRAGRWRLQGQLPGYSRLLARRLPRPQWTLGVASSHTNHRRTLQSYWHTQSHDGYSSISKIKRQQSLLALGQSAAIRDHVVVAFRIGEQQSVGAKMLTPFARLLQPQLCRSAVGKHRQGELAAAGAHLADFLNAPYQVATGK